MRKELPRGSGGRCASSYGARRTLGLLYAESFGGLSIRWCLVICQMTFGLLLVVAEALVAAKQDGKVLIKQPLVYFRQTLAYGARCFVLLALESFAGTWYFRTSSRVVAVVRAEWIVAVEPVILALCQDRNIRKGRQNWTEVVETMLLRLESVESNRTTIWL